MSIIQCTAVYHPKKLTGAAIIEWRRRRSWNQNLVQWMLPVLLIVDPDQTEYTSLYLVVQLLQQVVRRKKDFTEKERVLYSSYFK